MSDSKPEELVASLYETGMSDEEVRKQLEDFGLSSREIRHLMKKAHEVRQSSGKPDQPVQSLEPKPVQTNEKKGMLAGLFGGKKKEEKQKSPEPLMQKIADPSQDVSSKSLPETQTDTSPLTGLEEMPAESNETRTLDQLFASKHAALKSSDVRPKIESKPVAEGSTQEQPKEEKKKDQPKKEKKKGMFSGLFGKKDKSSVGDKDKKESKEDKKKVRKEEKKNKEEDKKKNKSRDVDIDKSTMKRLNMIKASISQPAETKATESKDEAKKEPEKPKEISARTWKPGQGEQDDEEPFSLIPNKEEEPPKNISKKDLKWMHPEDRKKFEGKDIPQPPKKLTPQEQEKMDQEIAKNLTEGMEKMQGEMSEIKDLLDTLRELNIKLIEILEKK